MARDDEPAGSADSQNSIAAPMPGKVIKVLVTQGDSVEEGAAMIIVEAMKMEHTLRAPINGVVTAIHCEEGQSVDGNIALAEIEVEEGE
jgi:3-methylcrotonyl-CoA carboxylase alpha subunit